MKYLFAMATLLLVSNVSYAVEDNPKLLHESLVSLQYQIIKKDCKSIVDKISRVNGVTYFKQDEMGPVSKEFYWKLNKDDLNKKELQNQFCDVISKGAEYVRKIPKPEIVSTNLESTIVWKIYDGRHAGNFRGFSIVLVLENKVWRIKSVDFPFDYTP